jgi:DNA helicase HerA-like ATPase
MLVLLSPHPREAAEKVATSLKSDISEDLAAAERISSTADTPLLIKRADLVDPTLIDRAVSQEDVGRIESHLTTLKLRLKTRLDDKRWQSFLNFEKEDTTFSNLSDWLKRFGFQDSEAPRVSVIDLSMLSHEALPYACAVLGRILLETRERLPANERYQHPWVLVLEEAHNYARPPRQNDDRGQELSRNVFERIAKEGRKFGLSLIVASQRPSEISPTIISQCANFISHRLQNPDDIDHFRRIIPMQARRLLDQVTVLAAGEAIVFGSAFHIPARVQVDIPNPPPWSQTAAPYHEWKKDEGSFPLEKIIKNWGLESNQANDGSSNSITNTLSTPPSN